MMFTVDRAVRQGCGARVCRESRLQAPGEPLLGSPGFIGLRGLQVDTVHKYGGQTS